MGDDNNNAVALFALVLLLLKVIAFNIITLFIKEITSLLDKFLGFSSIFNSNFIIRSSRGTKGRRKTASTYVRITITITIAGIRIGIRITPGGFSFNNNLL